MGGSMGSRSRAGVQPGARPGCGVRSAAKPQREANRAELSKSLARRARLLVPPDGIGRAPARCVVASAGAGRAGD